MSIVLKSSHGSTVTSMSLSSEYAQINDIDTTFINSVRILAEGHDVTITGIDLASRRIDINGADADLVEFAKAVDELWHDYLE